MSKDNKRRRELVGGQNSDEARLADVWVDTWEEETADTTEETADTTEETADTTEETADTTEELDE